MKVFLRTVFLSMLVLLLFFATALEAPISEEQAKSIAQNWLNAGTSPMRISMGSDVKSVTPFKDGLSGSAGYYFAQLSPNG